ncbi:MAG: TlyA family RNA methyltransferase [Acidimicrobiales bacterium]
MARRRLDAELVRRGLASSLQWARAEIVAGRVTVGGAPADNEARLVAPAEPIVVLGPPPQFVGRGGDKLEAALAAFEISVEGRRAVDLGASTGGFTDALLQRGASAVVAVDVGYGQLHERVRSDARVVALERTNARDLVVSQVGDDVGVLVADLSFISLRTVLPAIVGIVAPGADLVLLVKPQFEARRQEAARGRGIITDPSVWRRVLEEVAAALDALGAAIMGVMTSPITGADGNVEFLIHARAQPARPGAPIADLISTAVEAAGAVS